jgi:queuine tRNA-ribosyltransferase
MNMKNEKWKTDFSPLDPEGTSFVDIAYSKAYVRHLITTGERLGAQITSIHNLAFYLWLVDEARRRIDQGDFSEWKNKIVPELGKRL